jgi:GNAT superfamily N-acetyltransferase
VVIKKAQEKDINNLIELMQKAEGDRSKEWAEERAKRFVLDNKNRLIIIAEEKGKLVGYLGLKRYEDNRARDFIDINKFAWITWIAVLLEYRNKKIGSKLLKFSEEFAKNYDKLGIVLDCREKVTPFYIKNGYKIVGEYEHNKIPRYVLEKILQ